METKSVSTINTNTELSWLLCILIADKSGSMSGEPIEQVNKCISELLNQLHLDDNARLVTEICIIEFSDTVNIIQSFASIETVGSPHLIAGGVSSFNQAVIAALEEIENRRKYYIEQGIKVMIPWIFAITDGLPTDSQYEEYARDAIKHKLNYSKKKLHFFILGVGGDDIQYLTNYPCDICIAADRMDFTEAYKWLGNSLCTCSSGMTYSDSDAYNDLLTYQSLHIHQR